MDKKLATNTAYKVLMKWEETCVEKITGKVTGNIRGCAYCDNYDCGNGVYDITETCPIVISTGYTCGGFSFDKRMDVDTIYKKYTFERTAENALLVFDFLLNVAYLLGIESKYMEEIS